MVDEKDALLFNRYSVCTSQLQGLSAEQDRHCLAFVESGITEVTSKLEGINTVKERNGFFRKYLMGETSSSRLPLTTGKTRTLLRRDTASLVLSANGLLPEASSWPTNEMSQVLGQPEPLT